MRISDWSSDVCSSDLALVLAWLSQRWLQRRVVHPLRQLRDQVGDQRGAGHASRTHELDDLRQGIAALRRRIDDANHSADERVPASASEVVQQSAHARAAPPGTSRRSEERRLVQVCVSTCTSGWSPIILKTNETS